jgi:hypothetical protein
MRLQSERIYATESKAEEVAREFSDRDRDYAFYVYYSRSLGGYLVDSLGLVYSDEKILSSFYRTEKTEL